MSNFMPNLRFKGVQYIDFNKLKELGVKGVILDVDNTLIDYHKVVSEEIINWVNNAKENGFKLCIVSNTNNREKVSKVAETLDIEYIMLAKKPFKSGFLKGIKLLDMIPSEVASVGDQIFTDVIGANRLNMISIYVDPINKKEYWYTKWKRPIENLILKKVGY